MASIVESMMSQLATADNLSAISKSVGGDNAAVQSALAMGLPMVLGSMANKASTPSGADMLTKMLTQTGGASPLDNIGGFLGGSVAAGGGGMLNSLLGSQLAPIQNAISKKTGLPPAVVGQVLAIAAPMVMGYVGNMFIQKKMNTAGLTSLLGEQSKLAMQSSPDAAGLAKQFLAAPEVSGGIMAALKKFLKG
jgi:hypothetical protein